MDRFMRKCVVDRKIVELLIQKKSFNKIAKLLKVGKPRIRKVRDMADELGYLKGVELPLSGVKGLDSALVLLTVTLSCFEALLINV